MHVDSVRLAISIIDPQINPIKPLDIKGYCYILFKPRNLVGKLGKKRTEDERR